MSWEEGYEAEKRRQEMEEKMVRRRELVRREIERCKEMVSFWLWWGIVLVAVLITWIVTKS